MKLIQLNMANGRLLQPLLRFLNEQQADVICLQELEDTAEFDRHLVDIKRASGLTHHYFSPLSGYMMQGSFYEVGDCILSRTPIAEAQTILLHGAYDPDWQRLNPDYNNCRNLQSVKITIDGTVYHILNSYGYHIFGSKQGNEVTMRIMDTICDHIDTLLVRGEGPVIFASDTNLAPDSSSMMRLNTTLRNLCVEHDVKTTRNFVAKRLTDEVVDYICVSQDMVAKAFTVSNAIVSDHLALMLEI